jgi:transposase-like protein
VDKQGMTVDFLLRPDRGIAAAQAFFRKALATNPTRWPRKVTLDGQLGSARSEPISEGARSALIQCCLPRIFGAGLPIRGKSSR